MNNKFVCYFQHLRQIGVVGKFVEFFGPGVAELSIADRATIANMCPEYGATVGFFPVDDQSLEYLAQTGTVYRFSEALICKGCLFIWSYFFFFHFS